MTYQVRIMTYKIKKIYFTLKGKIDMKNLNYDSIFFAFLSPKCNFLSRNYDFIS